MLRYVLAMIKSFATKETAAIFSGVTVRKISDEIQRIARRKLLQLDVVQFLDELRIPPGNRLEELKGNRKGQWSIRVNDQWRICFTWDNGDVFDVELVDYH